jgi:hypothetical protein
MTTTVLKVDNCEFDLVTTMILLQQNPRLGEFFVDKFGDDFKQHFVLIKTDTFPAERIDYVEKIFNEVIKADDNYLEDYIKLLNKSEKPNRSPKKRPNIPKIKEDVKARGGKKLPHERALLAGNELKKVVAKINIRGVDDLFTEEESRDIAAMVETVKRKLDLIINKKTNGTNRHEN